MAANKNEITKKERKTVAACFGNWQQGTEKTSHGSDPCVEHQRNKQPETNTKESAQRNRIASEPENAAKTCVARVRLNIPDGVQRVSEFNDHGGRTEGQGDQAKE
jgi:hypothetical protein